MARRGTVFGLREGGLVGPTSDSVKTIVVFRVGDLGFREGGLAWCRTLFGADGRRGRGRSWRRLYNLFLSNERFEDLVGAAVVVPEPEHQHITATTRT